MTQTGDAVDERVILRRLFALETSFVLLLNLGRHVDVSTLSFVCNSTTSSRSTICDNLNLNESSSSELKQCVCVKELTRQLAPTTEGLKSENCTSEVTRSIYF